MSKECIACGKKQLDKDTVGINKKLLGKDIANFYCMDCLADFLGCTVDDLLDKIEEFKDIQILFSSIVLVRHSTKPHSTKQSEELSVIAMMSSFCTVMNLMCYFLILAATRLDIHLQQECVKLE